MSQNPPTCKTMPKMDEIDPLSSPTCTPHCMGSSPQKVTSRRGGGVELGANSRRGGWAELGAKKATSSESISRSARSQGAALLAVLGVMWLCIQLQVANTVGAAVERKTWARDPVRFGHRMAAVSLPMDAGILPSVFTCILSILETSEILSHCIEAKSSPKLRLLK